MKVIHLSISAGGGAGTAARRTVEALCQHGVEAELWTNDGVGARRELRSALWATQRRRLDRLPLRLHPEHRLYSVWSNDWLPSRLAPILSAARPDLVHLHWIGDGFIHLGELDCLTMPVVWTLHDAWAFTGGCHYPADCVRFKKGCGGCPQLGSSSVNDLSARNYQRKRRAVARISRWIAPSAWLGRLAVASGVVPQSRLRVVPNGFNEEVFTPLDGLGTRLPLGLAAGVLVIVAGATDLQEVRKGAGLLSGAVYEIQKATGRTCILLVFGKNSGSLPRVTGVEVRAVGEMGTEADMAAVLAAADLMLLPSLQDNLPNIAIEAQACGCPVIGFDTGGLREIIIPGVTGALATAVSAAGLAEATVQWLRCVPARSILADRCRVHFETLFTYPVHARRVIGLYEELLAEAPPK